MTASVRSRLSDLWTHYKVTEPYTLAASSDITIKEVLITSTLLIKHPNQPPPRLLAFFLSQMELLSQPRFGANVLLHSPQNKP